MNKIKNLIVLIFTIFTGLVASPSKGTSLTPFFKSIEISSEQSTPSPNLGDGTPTIVFPDDECIKRNSPITKNGAKRLSENYINAPSIGSPEKRKRAKKVLEKFGEEVRKKSRRKAQSDSKGEEYHFEDRKLAFFRQPETYKLLIESAEITGETIQTINLTHVCDGDKRGGLHYWSPSRSDRPSIIEINRETGVRYVSTTFRRKQKFKSLFPKDWNREDVVRAGRQAIENSDRLVSTFKGNRAASLRALSFVNNIFIEILINKTDSTETAVTFYPIMYYIRTQQDGLIINDQALPQVLGVAGVQAGINKFIEEAENIDPKDNIRYLDYDRNIAIIDIAKTVDTRITSGIYVEISMDLLPEKYTKGKERV